jgi:thioredoxin-dependent peroxiredoxin
MMKEKIKQLAEGDKAPAFTSRDQDNNPVSLSDFLGKKVVLYFYPQDDTPTCTVEACNLRDNFGVLTKEGWVVLGVSPDPVSKHKKFEEKYKLPFTLLADPERGILNKYGVWGDKKLFGYEYQGVYRRTFLIDEKGIIRKIFLRPRSLQHSREILEAWEKLEHHHG